jgi:tetratricopeptide (TPR) repeat protein
MSMTREQMLGYMENPAQLNEKSLAELREILDEFPYFQTAHLLYTRNLLNENNFRFANELKICALHATDRSMLYHLLNPEQKNQKSDESLEISISAGKKEEDSLIKLPEDATEAGKTLKTKEPIQSDETHPEILNFESGESIYRLEGVDVEPDKSLAQLVKEINKGSDRPGNIKQTKNSGDLIDRFIKENPSLSNRGFNAIENSYSGEDQDNESNENDEFITETLAKIYIKQGLYQKAIDAFHRLTLKYPEKSVYFARQIEEVKNLLNK